MLICMHACYLTWHLRRAWAPLTFTDQDPPRQEEPGQSRPALRNRPGQGLGQHDPAGAPTTAPPACSSPWPP